jgi:hypothetical protein
MTSQFKSFNYSFATMNVRVPMDAPFVSQQMKAGFDIQQGQNERQTIKAKLAKIKILTPPVAVKNKRKYIM